MAKQTTQFGLDPETLVEMISIKGEKVFSTEIKFHEIEKIMSGTHSTIKRKKGWIYKFYQKGFSQYSNVTKTN